MPHAFMQVGNVWLNLSLVTAVELIPATNPADPDMGDSVQVHFCYGAPPRQFKDPEEIKALGAWLRKHKAR